MLANPFTDVWSFPALFGTPADTTHIDQLLSARSTRFIAMFATLEQPGRCRISSNARHRKACIESKVFAISRC
jgi:hypothetical protein